MHGKLNRRKLDKLNLIHIWFALLLCFILVFFLKAWFLRSSLIFLNDRCIVCYFAQRGDTESFCSHGSETLWNSNGYVLKCYSAFFISCFGSIDVLLSLHRRLLGVSQVELLLCMSEKWNSFMVIMLNFHLRTYFSAFSFKLQFKCLCNQL